MMIRYLLTMFFVIIAGGCAAPVGTIDYYKLDTATLKRIKPLQEVSDPELVAAGYKSLGTVSGFHCRRAEGMGGYGSDKADAERTAIDQLRLRAAQKGASHYTSPNCTVRESMDLFNNCWASITCKSQALRKK